MHCLSATAALMPRPAQAAGRTSSWQAACISAIVHAGALAALCTIIVPPPRVPEPPPSFDMVMQAPEPAMEQSLAAKALGAETRVATASLAAPRPLSLAASPPKEIHVGRAAPRATPAPLPAASAPAEQPSVPAAAKPPSAPPPVVPQNELAGLAARIQQAVQSAAIYPAPARAMHIQGRTQVRFDYTDGAIGGADVSVTSASPMLDRAALAAVRRAALPRAPAQLGTRKLPLLVWVDFRLVRQD